MVAPTNRTYSGLGCYGIFLDQARSLGAGSGIGVQYRPCAVSGRRIKIQCCLYGSGMGIIVRLGVRV